jgi:nanoRNase/pAp phosphatase (c-di-AMP/oligoRNAs hydrolase)
MESAHSTQQKSEHAEARPVILYHGNCPDGFGGAYAAWKKFGDGAEYYPLSRDVEPPSPEQFADAHLYFIDFCYPQEIMDRYVQHAQAVTVLDHHEGVEDVITSMPEYRYTSEHSGAVISWMYFHPNEAAPTLLQYIEQGDLYRFGLPHTESVLTYVYTIPHTFAAWDNLSKELEDPSQFDKLRSLGEQFAEHKTIVVEQIIKQAELVSFEGYTCYLASCSKQFTSPVGNKLSLKLPPIALVASVHAWGLRVSLRSDGTTDVSALARKYGGNGHPYAAAFSLGWGDPIPWTPEHETDSGEA